MPTDYVKERQFFDRIASENKPDVMSREVLERYAAPRHPHLFGKEMMFHLAGDLKGKKVLEVGCGEGAASVQLAYCGALVDAIDLSPVSIERARERAQLNCQDVQFIVGDITKSNLLSSNYYDIVWCDLILHHLVDSLDSVVEQIKCALKPGGLLIAREPLAYARWLKAIRHLVPVRTEATDDEQPLRASELQIIRQNFPNVQMRYFRILARLDRMGASLGSLRNLARIDNLLLMIPGSSILAGNAVLWATKGDLEGRLQPNSQVR